MKTRTMLTINIITIGLALLALLSGCEDSPRQDALWRARAALAIAEAKFARPSTSTEHATTPTIPETTAQPTERRRRVIYFSATYCASCRTAERSLDLLRRAGWQVGDSSGDHIQVVAVDGSPREQALAHHWRVNAVPTWITIHEGQERARRIGPLDPFEIGALFDTP